MLRDLVPENADVPFRSHIQYMRFHLHLSFSSGCVWRIVLIRRTRSWVFLLFCINARARARAHTHTHTRARARACVLPSLITRTVSVDVSTMFTYVSCTRTRKPKQLAHKYKTGMKKCKKQYTQQGSTTAIQTNRKRKTKTVKLKSKRQYQQWGGARMNDWINFILWG